MLISIGNLLNLCINLETYFLNLKLEGQSAMIYLSLNGFIPILLIYLIIKKDDYPWNMAFFGFNLIDSIIISAGIRSIFSLMGLTLSSIMVLKAQAHR